MKRLIPFGLVAAIMLFTWLLSATHPGGMPQVASGGDFLSVLLGDAKVDLSYAMIQEADSYFHGGIDMECHELKGHAREHGEVARDHDAYHGACGHGEDCHCGHAHETIAEQGFDLWRWINLHVRAPEIEKHLEGEKAVEMMPWFWMAVKSDPHNEEAWSTAWYVAAHMIKDDMLAFKIAEEGWRLNPESVELACVLGRAYRAPKTTDLGKSEAVFEDALKIGRRKEKMTEKEGYSFCEALGYLSEYAAKRKDKAMLQRLLDEAKELELNHPVVQTIEARLSKLQPK